jgi:alpha-beta hydrolase superfamily lysophospholipase
MATSIFDHPAFSASLFFPRRDASDPPEGARDLWIDVADGVRLHARLHEAHGSRVRILLFHGNGEIVSDYDGSAHAYLAAGADLAVVDYRGYGRSGGQPTARDCLHDTHPVVARLAAEPTASGVPPRLVVMGRSLGSACAAEVCRAAPREVVGIVLESGFADLGAFVERRGIRGVALSAQDVDDFSPLHKLRSSTLPLLVLHGAEDAMIPPSNAQMAYEASGSADRRLVLVPGRGHNDVADHPLYWEALQAFVARLRSPSTRTKP